MAKQSPVEKMPTLPQRGISPMADKYPSPRSGSDSGYDDTPGGTERRPTRGRQQPKMGPNDVKVKIHTEKATLMMISYKNIYYEDFIEDLCTKLGVDTAPDSICFPDPDTNDDNAPMISMVDQDDLDICFAAGQVVHVYIKNEGLLDFY
ncbi:hypothetical protein HDU91_000569 [Kappamyces sp. JEL0680]|nr:hypothetical protein HDU91_000569 [Kappamyces sp. JEL0680]